MSEVKVKKAKKEYVFALRFVDIESNRSKSKGFNRLDKARKWVIDIIGPEWKISEGSQIMSNSMMKAVFIVKGTTPQALMIDPLPVYPKRGGFKVNVEERKTLVAELVQLVSDSYAIKNKNFLNPKLTETFTTSLFGKYIFRKKSIKNVEKK